MVHEVTAKTYHQLEVIPGAVRAAGEMELNQKTHGFYFDALTTAMIAEHALGALQPMTLITDAENVKVVKKASETWVAGNAVYWLEATSNFSISPGDAGVLVGKAQRAAGNAAIIGFISMKDFYPWNGGVYTMAADHPLAVLKGTSALTAGNVTLAQIELINTAVGVATYFKGLEVNVKSNFKSGYGAWAIQGNLDFQTNGQMIGKGAAIEAGLTMAALASVSGHYYALDAEISVPTGGSWSGYPGALVAFARYKAEGDGVAAMRDDGYFFTYDGSGGGGSGKLFFVNTVTATLRCKINSVDYFLQFHKVEAAS